MSALSNIRNGLNSSGSSIIVGILIFGLVATFGGFIGSSGSLIGNEVFSVKGKSISQGEYSLEYNRIYNLLNEDQNEIDPNFIDQLTRESITYKELNYQSAIRAGFNLSEQEINKNIKLDQSFYVDGKFDVDLYRGFLSRLGMTPTDFKEFLKSRTVGANYTNFIEKSSFLPNFYLRDFLNSTKQSRDITFVKVALEDEAQKEKVSSDEIDKFYQNNKYQFIESKKISYNYLSLNSALFIDDIEISDQEINEEKEALKDAFKSQKRISHIEISYDENSKQDALLKAKELSEELSISPNKFNLLVQNFSSDLGTKDIEGDLGFTDGSFFPEEFESEIKLMEIGDISKVIDLGNSLHILKLTEKTNNSLSEKELKEKITLAKANDKLNEILLTIEDSIEDISLDDIYSDLNLSPETVTSESLELFVNKYSDLDFLDDLDQNSLSRSFGPYDINGEFLIFKILNYENETFKILEEVKSDIISEIKLTKAKSRLKEIIKIKKKELLSDPSKFTSYVELKRGNSLLPVEVTSKIFLSSVEANDAISVEALDGDIYIFKLDQVNKFKGITSNEEIEASKDYLDNIYKRIVLDSYNESLRDMSGLN